ncbi:MAG: peptidyl-prolyl cis-trans isomerase [Candidatus Latescibacteria bacterium]|nr:peptidyl-prolyl cis-trans isomerase [Candidatus Latescibacterota bacterium]
MKKFVLLGLSFFFSVVTLTECVLADEKGQEVPNPIVIVKTNKGTIEIELFSDRAPQTVTNFLSYVLLSFYDGTIFHRIIPGFMIQGGGFTPDMEQKPTKPPIVNEAANGLKNKRGTIAMARTPEPHSATCQFFINHRDNPALDFKDNTAKGYGYCVFGRVIEGMDVVDKIAKVTTTKVTAPDGNQHQNVPVKNVLIESIRVKK